MFTQQSVSAPTAVASALLLPRSIEELVGLDQLLKKRGVEFVSPDYRELFESSERMVRLANSSVCVFRHEDLRTLGANANVANLPLDVFMPLTFGGSADHPLRPDESGQIRRFQSNQFFTVEPGSHRLLKPLFVKPLLPKEMPPFVSIAEGLTRSLIDQYADAGEFDLVSDFCGRLGVEFWGRVFKMTDEEVAAMQQIMIGMAPVSVPGARGRDELVVLNQTIPDYFDLLRRVMLRAQESGQHIFLNRLAEEFWRPEKNLALLVEGPEIFMAANMIDGFHAMGVGISNSVYQLALNPDAFSAVRENEALADVAVNEALRLNSPVAAINRLVLEDMEYDGLSLPAGTVMMLHWAAGNRDPEVHEKPSQYDLNRPQVPLTTFGGGAQLCPGRNLSRALAAQVVKLLATSGVRMRIVGDVEWIADRATISMQYPSRVPIVLERL